MTDCAAEKLNLLWDKKKVLITLYLSIYHGTSATFCTFQQVPVCEKVVSELPGLLSH